MTQETDTAEVSIEELEAALNGIENTPRPEATFVDPFPTAPATAASIAPVVAVAQVQAPTASPLDLREYVNVEQLKADVSIDLHDLDNTMRKHASMFVHYSNLARLARRQYESMKRTVEVLEKKLYMVHRERMTGEGKKPTEAAIDAAVKVDPRWMAAQRKEIDARAIFDLADSAREAFAHNRDMLIQVSSDRRREREGELRMNAAKDTVDAARNDVLRLVAGAAQSLTNGDRQ
jgi:hypothetical protein